ncbi:MAG: hypothetical protein RLZZ450_808 [Pseudomonadota bacterium]|jgi:hypothetical protein
MSRLGRNPRVRATTKSTKTACAWAGLTLCVVLAGCGDDDGTKTLADAGPLAVDASSSPSTVPPATTDGGVVTPGTPGTPVTPAADGSTPVATTDAGTPVVTAPVDSGAPVVDTKNAVYAVSVQVLGDEADNTYVSTLKNLEPQTVDTKQAIEVGGRSSIATVGGWLFIGEEESPVLRRFAVGADGKLAEDKDKQLNFSNEGLSAVSLDEWNNTFISPTKAYLSDGEGGFIVWNPTTMAITGRIPAVDLAREGLSIDGSPGFVRGNRLFRTVFWKNWEEFKTSSEQYVLVYDTDTDKLLSKTPESRCPGLNAQITADEKGTLYFSNWVYNVAETLVRQAPKSCAIRILPGAETADPSWVLPYADITGGKEGAGFAYTKDGKALLSVFDATGLTFDANTDLSKVSKEVRWDLYTVDLETKAVAKMEGAPRSAGGYTQLKLDGLTLAFFPAASYESTTLFELPTSGPAKKRLELPGFAYQLVRIK